MAQIRCPHCATVFALAIARPGTVTECPQCKRPCRLPASKLAGSSTVSAAPPPPAPAPPAVPPAPAPAARAVPPAPTPAAPILQFDPEQAVPSLEIDSDPWSGRSPTPAGKYEERWRHIDPHPTAPRPPVPAPPAPPAASPPQPQVPCLEIDKLPEPLLEIDPDPPPVPAEDAPAPGAGTVPSIPAPLLPLDPAEEEVLALPPDCVEEDADEPVVQGELVEEDAEEEAEEAEVLDYPDAPRRRSSRRRKKGGSQRLQPGDLDKVYSGLGLHYVRLGVIILGSALMFLGMVGGSLAAAFASFGGRGAGPSSLFGLALLAIVSGLVAFLIEIVAPLLGIVGSSLCLWMSSQTGARGLMLGSLILDGTAAFLGLVFLLVAVFSPIPGAAILYALPAFGLGFASWVLFMLSLGRLCAYLREAQMAEEATEVLIRGCVILLSTPVVLTILQLLALSVVGPIFSPPVALTFLYHYFVFLRRQFDLIGSLRAVIATRW